MATTPTSNSDVENDNQDQSTLPDLSKSEWKPVASFPDAREGPGCAVIDSNRFLLMGGFGDNRRLSSCVMYDRTLNSWTTLGKSCHLPKAISYCAAVGVNGKIHVAGGRDDNHNVCNDVLVLDASQTSIPSEWKWTPSVASMNEKRCYFAMVVTGNFIYALGGNNGNETLNTVEKFNISSGTWENAPPMTTKRVSFAAAVVGKQIYAIGGRDENNTPMKTTEVFNLNDKDPTWKPASDMNHERRGHAAVVIDDKYIVVSGGADNKNNNYLSSVEVLDTTSGKWTKIHKNMSQSRSFHASVVMNQTDIFVAGGNDETSCETISLPQLMRPSPYGEGVRGPSLKNDSPTKEDLLGISDEVKALAQVIAMSEFMAPFVLAILAGWGGGKSTAMTLILENLKEIQEIDLTDGDMLKDFPYCGHIYYVWFDCWTYSKDNLWASLMHQILISLNRQLEMEKIIGPELLMKGASTIKLIDHFNTAGKQEYLNEVIGEEETRNKIQKLVDSKNNNVTNALIKATTLAYENDRSSLRKKENELKKKQIEADNALEKEKTKIAWVEMFDENSKIDVSQPIKRILQRIIKQHIEKCETSEVPMTIMKGLENLKTFERYWFLFRAGKMSTAWAIAFSISVVAAILLPLLWKELEGLYAIVAPLVTGIIGITTKLHAAALEISQTVQPVFEVAVANANAIDLEMQEENEENTNEIKDEIAKINVEISELENRVWLVEGNSLDDVIKDRFKDGKYEEKLGLLHRAKQDLERLSKAMLSNAEADKEKHYKKRIFPRGDPRIVLFVDDLDRCSPDKVVEMLEAIQLLVKTKLFVIVAAIDSLYVTLSLEHGNYKDILRPDRHPSGLDYLEKIIQLTYRVPPIQFKEDLETYVKAQMGPCNDSRDEEASANTDKSRPIPYQASQDTQPASEIVPAEEVSQDAKPASEIVPSEKPEVDDNEEGEKKEVQQAERPPSKEQQLVPKKALQFTTKEVTMMIDALMVADVSPRATKRIVNAFKLLILIWYGWGENPNYKSAVPKNEKKEALVYLLALSGSNCKVIRRGLCKLFSRIEKDQNDGETNIKDMLDSCFESSPKDPFKEKSRSKVGPMLSALEWNNDNEWKELKRGLRLIRAFSFLGEEEETTDKTPSDSEQTANRVEEGL